MCVTSHQQTRSKELLDNILPLSNTLCRIRDKCLKSLIFTDLRVLDWFQSITVSVNSSGIKDNRACFGGSVVYLGPQVVLDLTGMKSGARYVHTHLSWPEPDQKPLTVRITTRSVIIILD